MYQITIIVNVCSDYGRKILLFETDFRAWKAPYAALNINPFAALLIVHYAQLFAKIIFLTFGHNSQKNSYMSIFAFLKENVLSVDLWQI